jgi:small conductance mechanosensitive channel
VNGIQSLRLAETAGDLWQKLIGRWGEKLTDIDTWTYAGDVAIRIVLILLASRVALWILNRIIDHFTSEREMHRLKLRSRRVQTVGRLLKNTASYTVNFIVLLLILGEFRINLAPLLAGAGVVGLAIGFGAQSLVKDVISGFFIILEDQFAVGDVIQIGNYRGTVEMIGLRTTRLRAWTGELHIVPNGTISDVTNYSVYNSLALVDVTVAYEEQLEEVSEVIRGVLTRFEDSNMTGAPELLGVQSMGPAGLVLRIAAECKPNTQAIVTRNLNAELKKAFEAKGLQLPYPRTVTYHRGEAKERMGG